MDEDTGSLRTSLAYPFGGETPRTRLLVGGGLNLLAGVVFVGAAGLASRLVDEPLLLALVALAVALVGALTYVPVLGYAATTMRAVLDGQDDPPEFGTWGPLLRDGVRLAGVALLYGLPLVALSVLASTIGTGGSTASLAATALAAPYALALAYVLPAVAVVVVERGEAGAAWDAATLREAVLDRDYFGQWALAVAVAAVGGLVGAALAAVLVGFVVAFVAEVAAAYAVTRGVIAALDISVEQPPAPPASGYVPGWEDGPRREELSSGFGGSLLPTTPDDDVDTNDEDPAPGSLVATGGDAAADVERSRDEPATGVTGGAAGGSSTAQSATGDAGSDIEPFEEGEIVDDED